MTRFHTDWESLDVGTYHQWVDLTSIRKTAMETREYTSILSPSQWKHRDSIKALVEHIATLQGVPADHILRTEKSSRTLAVEELAYRYIDDCVFGFLNRAHSDYKKQQPLELTVAELAEGKPYKVDLSEQERFEKFFHHIGKGALTTEQKEFLSRFDDFITVKQAIAEAIAQFSSINPTEITQKDYNSAGKTVADYYRSEFGHGPLHKTAEILPDGLCVEANVFPKSWLMPYVRSMFDLE